MRHGMSHRQDVHTGVGVRIDPRVILGSQMLQLAQPELAAAIENELMENPALERLDEGEEPLTREAILRSIAPRELAPQSEDFEFRRSIPDGHAEEVDWLDLAPASDSVADHLRAQLLPGLPSDLRGLGEYLIGSLDDRGYLGTTVEEAALDCGRSLEDSEYVLRMLQRCEPLGIGASSLQECLLLQLQNSDTLEGKLARGIVKNHFEDFRHRNLRPIMRRYRVLPEVVQAAFELILTLTPYPTEVFRSHYANVGDVRVAARPDLAFHLTEAGWIVDVVGEGDVSLAISRSYRRRQQELQAMARPPKEERQHVGEYIDRAKRFIDAIEQRHRTLRRIGLVLLEKQAGFISTGEHRFLNALTRTQVAKAIGLHESTVSRATQGKFVQIATGEVVSFDIFFKPALRVQKMIEEILAHENPNHPLSDDRIAQMLAEQGVFIARRTVNKYRDRTRRLSSRKRKSA